MASNDASSESVDHDPWIEVFADVVSQELERRGVTELDAGQLDRLVNNSIQHAGRHMAAVWKQNAKLMLADREQERLAFEHRLQQHWGKGLDLLYTLISVSQEAGERHNKALRPRAIRERDFVFEAQVRLHVKACQVASEVWHLLRVGYAMGAHSRWRTLHEKSIVSGFLGQNDNETAERYLLHEVIESYKAMEEYSQAYKRLGYDPPDPAEVKSLQEQREKLLQRFGEDYRHAHGWAAKALGNRKPTLKDIEAAVKLDHLRPFYGMANHGIHAGARGLFFNLGLQPNDRLPIAGASNGGLADPGHATAISLVQVWAQMVTRTSRTEDIIVLRAMSYLVDNIGEAFIRAHRKHQKKTLLLRQEKRKQEIE